MANRTGKGHFQKGNKAAPGGARANSGRKPGWLKERCAELLAEKRGEKGAEKDLVDFMGSVAHGEKQLKMRVDDKNVELPADLDQRMKAVEWLADRAEGRASQSVDVTAKVIHSFDIIIDGIKE